MKVISKVTLSIALVLASPMTLQAQNVANTSSYAYLQTLPVPVVEGDITDRPYRVIGNITKGVRKATIFSKAASYEKVMREIWEKAEKMGADAVVHAQFGEARRQMFSSWGTREARGVAIKFLTDAEIAALDAKTLGNRPDTIADDLAKLARLRDDGLITAADYEAAKTRLLRD